ncbi:LpqB family beta-propeller domain-containing protein [Nocardioides sambongensis]|uniref:LpqB family beta-propeller domain-containing protein n=1 Tax=Nocardioides sambongensis TaxID=2589074 RepID=UPI001127C9D6|nr:LpqB family beta-propeller domain-containing protein [Nocardioides sambongensis]
MTMTRPDRRPDRRTGPQGARGRGRLRRLLALGGLVLALGLAGCVGLPEDGPIVTEDADVEQDTQQALDIDARPPVEGASRLQVVTGFLDAMTAWPIQTSVAKEYLTADAADVWSPETSTVVYSDAQPPQQAGVEVTVELTGADLIDEVGSWRGALPRRDQTLRFPMAIEDGEFRIAAPPDALVVPAGWFQQRFQQVSLYYFTPNAQTLVPEPVFLPQGDQLATSLVSALLSGPPAGLRDVVRSFMPEDVSIGLSVPVSESGVAEINMIGEAPRPSTAEAELMVAQMAWTLRQAPDITAFRIRMDGEDIRVPGGATLHSVQAGARFDPKGAGISTALYGLHRGRVVTGAPADLGPVDGPFGTGRYQMRSVGVAPDGSQAIGITGDGTTALRSSIVASDTGEPADVDEVLTGVDLARPTWDVAGGVWLLDRRPGGAVLWRVWNGRTEQVRIPGMTGRDVSQILASRDGTRLIAVVRRPSGGDAILSVRIVLGAGGAAQRALQSTTIDPGIAGRRIVSIAWSTRNRIAGLVPARPGSLFEVDIVPSDGAEVGVDTLSTIVSGRVLGLAGPVDENQPTFAVLADSLVDVRTRGTDALNIPVTQLGYAG